MTSSHQSKAEHAAMFQVEGGQAMVKPEDKFLKEITAKIANRHVGAPGEEGEGVPGLRDDVDPNQASQIDAHLQRMRKQKQPADSVHQALVSELRRHLSEGEEAAAPMPPNTVVAAELPEKTTVKRPVKKLPPPIQQKPSSEAIQGSHHLESPSSSPGPPDVGNKRLKTDSGDREPLLPAPPPPPLFVKDHVTSVAQENRISLAGDAPFVCPMEESEPCRDKKELSEGEEELDFSERSALLRPSSVVSEGKRDKVEKQTFISSDVVAVEVNTKCSVRTSGPESDMQVSSHGLPDVRSGSTKQQGNKGYGEDEAMPPAPHDIGAEGIERGEEDFDIKIKAMAPVASSKPQAPFHYDHEASGDEAPKSHSPSVAPKPRGKDRHSFPAAYVTSESTSSAWSGSSKEGVTLSVGTGARPKSEMLKTSLEPDSVV